jgi:hypothetical protein
MGFTGLRVWCGCLSLGLLAACSTVPGGGSQQLRERGEGVVVRGEQLRRLGSGPLLESLKGRVTNLQVDRRSGSCPRITLRGDKRLLGVSNPGIYVDGTRSVDTCILDVVRVNDVERVEIYAAGSASSRPGYRPSPFGLILVFTLDRVPDR